VTTESLARRFALSTDLPERFFAVEADRISRACLEMARRFRRGGRLLVFGEGAQASDARHVAVEFMHPVLVGKRALPALALEPVRGAFGAQIDALVREADIAMGLAAGAPGGHLLDALERARHRGALTIALSAGPHPAALSPVVDFSFTVPCEDPLGAQEVHETLYHILWELVHVFFDHDAI
jgi:D-sedoheptulose 7-phosphate isomerase